MKYKLRRSIGVPAEIAGTELARIADEQGKITPEFLVDESRDPDAPLHAAFTWDDEVAGPKWRLLEARNIIRAVHIVDEGDGSDRGCAFAHVTIEDEESGAYMPVATVVKDADLFSSAIRGLARKQSEASKALADLEAEARRLKKRKHVGGLGRARQATEKASEELSALS